LLAHPLTHQHPAATAATLPDSCHPRREPQAAATRPRGRAGVEYLAPTAAEPRAGQPPQPPAREAGGRAGRA
jgi:hypothetical protein